MAQSKDKQEKKKETPLPCVCGRSHLRRKPQKPAHDRLP